MNAAAGWVPVGTGYILSSTDEFRPGGEALPGIDRSGENHG